MTKINTDLIQEDLDNLHSTISTEISDINTYSTTEINTGKTWIDGKSIYRIVLSGTTSSSRDDYFFSAIPNLDTCVNVAGILLDSGYKLIVPSWGSSSNWVNVAMNNTNQVYLGYSSQYRSKDIKIIVEYTKTTD